MTTNAQTPTPNPTPQAAAPPATQTPAADPKDVATMDAIVAAVYDVISGPAGQKRDWDRFRSLFIPEARLIPNGVRPDGTTFYRVLTVDQFAERSGASSAQNAFYENEIARRQEQYANIAHLFST